jgi:hypothetical protein
VAAIPLTQWAPDLAQTSGAQSEAKGVISKAGRYTPLGSLVAYHPNARIVDPCQACVAFYSPDGGLATFMADKGRIYRLVNKAPLDVSRAGGYAGDPDWAWSFEQFGANVLACQRNVPLQRIELGSTGTFADLSGNPPPADGVFRVRNHMLAAKGLDLSWSAFNNIEIWDPDPALGSGSTQLGAQFGQFQVGLGGEAGFIFQERGVSRLTYVGPPTTWVLDEVEQGRGCIGPKAAVKWGRNAVYVSEDGFFLFDGLQSQSIGDKTVDHYFQSRLNYSARHRVSISIDGANKSVMIAIPTGTSLTPNELLIYSYADQRWTHDDIPVQLVTDIPREPVTADDTAGLIALFGSAATEAINVSLDNPVFRENRRRWAAVDVDGTLSLFEGPSRTATLDTNFAELQPGRKAYVTEIWPQIDAAPADVTAQVSAKLSRLDEVATVFPAEAMTALGNCPARVDARWLKVRMSIAAGATWTEATGFGWDGSISGAR